MGDCERLLNCSFFQDKMANLPKTAELLKTTYCKSNYTECARYLVFKANIKVPSDLFPYYKEGAARIIKREQ